MPATTCKGKVDCAPPVWANLFFYRPSDGAPVWNGSVGFHGLPRVGDWIEVDTQAGTVQTVKYAPSTDGSFKATIWVEARP